MNLWVVNNNEGEWVLVNVRVRADMMWLLQADMTFVHWLLQGDMTFVHYIAPYVSVTTTAVNKRVGKGFVEY